MHIFTSANLAYLPQALVLLETLREHAPDARVVLVLVDRVPAGDDFTALLGRFDEVIEVEELLGHGALQWLFRYDVVEACTSVKGRALRVLLERGEPVVYLDPDIAVFAPLDEIGDALKRSSVLLTPHQLQPVPESNWVPDEITSLRYGAFNFGFLAVAPTDEGRLFAEWWDRRLEDYSFDNPEAGLFTDQKWGNLVPALFGGSKVLRHPGLNVASWNLHERTVSVNEHGEYEVAGEPLVFFHFTKAQHVGLDVVRTKWADNAHVAGIWSWYLRRLSVHSGSVPETLWTYGTYWDGSGERIPREDRRAFARLHAERRSPNPFVLRR